MKNTPSELITRLSRIEGQIGALKRSLAAGENVDCEQTLIQLKAATNGLKRFGEVFTREYAQRCITEKKNQEELARELDRILATAFTLS